MSHSVNICFHGVGTPARELEPGEQRYWINEVFFHQLLDLVTEHDDIAISFDDGNASDVAIALPALRERGLAAAFYPVGARIGRGGSVDADGLRELATMGMTIGSHGMNHLPWRGMSDGDLREELVEARAVIAAAAGTRIDAAALPLGSYDRRVLTRLRKLGYRQVFTSDRATARATSWLQPRFSVRSGDDLESVRKIVATRPPVPTRVTAAVRIAVKRAR